MKSPTEKPDETIQTEDKFSRIFLMVMGILFVFAPYKAAMQIIGEGFHETARVPFYLSISVIALFIFVGVMMISRSASGRPLGTEEQCQTSQSTDSRVEHFGIRDLIPSQPKTKPATEKGWFRIIPEESAGDLGMACIAAFGMLFTLVLINSMVASLCQKGLGLSDFVCGLPIVLIAIGVVWYAGRIGLRALKFRGVHFEVERTTVAPGERFAFVVFHHHRFPIEEVRLYLACRETTCNEEAEDKVNARQSKRVFRSTIISQCNPKPGTTGVLLRGEIAIPDSAMHSFISESNQIDWLVELRLVYDKGKVELNYPISVEPVIP